MDWKASEQFPPHEKAHQVRQIFRRVARRYDVMNDLMSLGVHRLWKRYTVLKAGVFPGDRILDLAGGTGDLAVALARRVGPRGRVILADINEAMLAVGRERVAQAGLDDRVDFVLADAEALPFAPESFDGITMAFGLRNVSDKAAALRSIHGVLRPGALLHVLEFSHPQVRGLESLYDAYSYEILPTLGQVVAEDADSYRYLVDSIRAHPDQDTLRGMMLDAGFDRCQYINLWGGIVALHRARKR